uniref:Portal protein n=1 Tax=Dulem virus 33 TaxID=3145751 RepID=A0AAU8B5L0_9CAUD
MDFIMSAINGHKASELYKMAVDAEEYDRQRNVTILSYQKLLYTLAGKAVPDNYSANYKIASNFFNRFVTQENQYLLGNGVTLDKKANKDKLGMDFDQVLQRAGRNALVQAVCFGFWNLDHLEVFKLTEFVPLYDEENAALMAGIRFWQISEDKPLRATLFELDGYTDYIRKDGNMIVLYKKRNYKQVVRQSEADGVEIYDGGNYPGFPIIPLWGNPHHQSELVGLRQSIDAYDLIKSGFANDVDDASQIYWIMSNTGGMDDVDRAQFLSRIKATHIVDADASSGTETEAHTIEAPYLSRTAYLDRLEQDMYNDYQALNVSAISGGQKTATEITAAYQPFDNKVDQFEYCVRDFLRGLFQIVGIEGKPSFTRIKIPTQSEDMQVLLMAAQYLDDEYVTKKVCAILGDPDAAEEILKRKAAEDLDRLSGGGNDDGEDQPEEVITDGETG